MNIIKVILFFCICGLVVSKISINQIQQKLKDIAQSPIVNLLFFFDSLKMKADDVKGYLSHVAASKKGFFEINIFDCQQIEEDTEGKFPYCTGENRQKLPQLTFTEPAMNPYTQQKNAYGARQLPFQGALQQKKLYQFAQPLIRTYSRNIKSISDLRHFVEDFKDIPRVIYFTDKQKLSFYFKALTGNFRHTIAFAHVHNNNTKVCQELKVSTFPTLLLNQKQSLEINAQLPKQIQYMQQFASPQKKTIIISAETNSGQDVIETAQQLQSKVLQATRYSVIHITDGKDHPAWKGLKKKLVGGFDYFTADKSMASQLGVKNLPSIVFYHKSIAKKQSMRTNFHQKIMLRDILNQIISFIDDYSVSIGSNEQMQRHTGLAFKQKRKVAVLFINDQVPVGFTILSNSDQFKNKLEFYKFKNPQPAVLQQFQVTKKLPALVIMYVDQDVKSQQAQQMQKRNKEREDGQQYSLRVGHFNGGYSYDELKIFLDSFLQQIDRNNNKGKQPRDDSVSEQRNLLQVKSMKHLNKYCVKDSCYLLLVNNNPDYSQSSKNAVNFVKPITKRIYENVVWADGVCHPQLLNIFDVQQDDLPVLLYVNHKFQKFSKLIGRITQQSPNQFVSKVKNNKINFRSYQKLVIEDKNCEQVHAKIDSLKFASSQLTQQQKQILQQIKRQEEIRRKEADDATKSKKKKPKKPKKKVQEDSEL